MAPNGRSNGRAALAPPAPAPEPAAPTLSGTFQMDEIYQEIIEEIQRAESAVRSKELELAQAREQLAAARGKLDLLGLIQQRAFRPQNGD